MFEQTEYFNETFKNLAGQAANFSSIEFNKCTFEQCNFEKSVFKSCKFIECNFKNCNLSLIKVPNSSFIDTKFKDCKMIGINWTEIARKIFSVSFSMSILNFSSFQGLNLQKCSMTDCKAHEVDFSTVNMTQAICKATDFSGSRFSRTNLTKADFTDARNYSINPTENILAKAKFSLPEAVSLLSSFDIELV